MQHLYKDFGERMIFFPSLSSASSAGHADTLNGHFNWTLVRKEIVQGSVSFQIHDQGWDPRTREDMMLDTVVNPWTSPDRESCSFIHAIPRGLLSPFQRKEGVSQELLCSGTAESPCWIQLGSLHTEPMGLWLWNIGCNVFALQANIPKMDCATSKAIKLLFIGSLQVEADQLFIKYVIGFL